MNLQDMLFAGLMIAVIGISLSLSASVTGTVQGTQTANSVAWAATGNATSGIGQLASWLPTIAIVVAASIIIGLLLRSFVFKKGD